MRIDILKEYLEENTAVLIYFNASCCSVGESLLPKVKHLIGTSFPKIALQVIDINENPEIAAHYNVFVEPSVLIFFEGKETIRRSRNVSILELSKIISKYYSLIF